MASTKAAVAALLAIAIVASIVFAQDPNNPTYGYVPQSLKTSASSTVAAAATGLTLALSLNATTIRSGQTVNFSASEYNTLPVMNNVTASSDWALQGLSLSICGTVNQPFGMAVFKGYYTESNISSAKPLLLYQPFRFTSCPMILSEISQYSFYPQSSKAQVWGSCSPGPCQVRDASARNEVSGFWNAFPILELSYRSTLSSGVYTVAAGDEWGQLVLLYFVVKA